MPARNIIDMLYVLARQVNIKLDRFDFPVIQIGS
jgi:hypothetical protein